MAVGTPSPRRPAERLRFRRNVDRLTARQLAILRRAFERSWQIADDRGHGRLAGEHSLPFAEFDDLRLVTYEESA